MKYKLSILICSLPERANKLISLLECLHKQSINKYEDIVEVGLNDYVEMTIGEKRNRLLQNSGGEYICFIDDDDSVSDNYIDLLMEGINKGVDCCSLKGCYFENNVTVGLFEHSIKYNEWKTNQQHEMFIKDSDIMFERFPNHLNTIKASIAKQFKFPDKNFGEDHDWSKQIHESGLIKTEHYIDQVIYYYKKVTK